MYYFRQVANQAELNEMFRLRHQVYCEEKEWFPPSNNNDGLEQDRYDEISAHFSARDRTGQLIGCARLIPYTEELNLQIASHPNAGMIENFHNSAEISRLVSQKGHRFGVIALGLIRMIFQRVTRPVAGLRFLYIGVDQRFFTVLRSLGFDFQGIGSPAMFHGDPLILARINVGEMDASVRNGNERFHAWLTEKPELITDNSSFSTFRLLKSDTKRNGMEIAS